MLKALVGAFGALKCVFGMSDYQKACSQQITCNSFLPPLALLLAPFPQLERKVELSTSSTVVLLLLMFLGHRENF